MSIIEITTKTIPIKKGKYSTDKGNIKFTPILHKLFYYSQNLKWYNKLLRLFIIEMMLVELILVKYVIPSIKSNC